MGINNPIIWNEYYRVVIQTYTNKATRAVTRCVVLLKHFFVSA